MIITIQTVFDDFIKNINAKLLLKIMLLICNIHSIPNDANNSRLPCVYLLYSVVYYEHECTDHIYHPICICLYHVFFCHWVARLTAFENNTSFYGAHDSRRPPLFASSRHGLPLADRH